MSLARRSFLAGGLALAVAACTRRAVDGGASLDDHVRGEPLHVPVARSYLVDVPADRVDDLLEASPEVLHEGIRLGVLALSDRCPVDGCRLTWRGSVGRFECGCDAAAFSRTGELVAGPGDRGMARHPVEVDAAGEVVIDTAVRVEGPARPDA